MKKKQIKHFVPHKDDNGGGGVPACKCFGQSIISGNHLVALTYAGEVAKSRRDVTCANCRATRVFRKLK